MGGGPSKGNKKVCIVGASGGIGQPLSMLMKLSPYVSQLSLYDLVSTPGVATDLSHINTKSKVIGYIGQKELSESLKGSDFVIIPAGVPLKPGMTRDDLFKINAGIVKQICESIADSCPDAWVAIISNPINSTVPIAAQVFKNRGTYQKEKLFGVTTLDILRAETFAAEYLQIDPEKVRVPVVGGHTLKTILPLLSQCKPKLELDEKELGMLTQRIQEADFLGTVVVDAKAGDGSSTLSMAYAAYKFAESCLKAMCGGVTYDTAFVESNINIKDYIKSNEKIMEEVKYNIIDIGDGRLPFFAQKVKMGKNGIEEYIPLGDLSDTEQRGLALLYEKLKGSIDKGIEFVQKNGVINQNRHSI